MIRWHEPLKVGNTNLIELQPSTALRRSETTDKFPSFIYRSQHQSARILTLCTELDTLLSNSDRTPESAHQVTDMERKLNFQCSLVVPSTTLKASSLTLLFALFRCVVVK